ncbi:MAG: glycosyltransferase family 2 protein [Parvularcula sp.]|nr:glycosyltransferase family 2 protein [Parvularcula sp.]
MSSPEEVRRSTDEDGKDRPDVSILVVAYNSADLIGACLDSIPAACARFEYEVLLIDNGDGSTQALVEQDYPDVKIVASQGNVGFAAGNNLLAKQARGRNLLLLNPDVEMKPHALDFLLEASATYSDAAAWGGVTLDERDRPDLGNTVQVPSIYEMASRLLGRSSAARNDNDRFDTDVRVEAHSGSFVMFDRDAWDEVGGLDPRYFLYCEEVDLFYRLAKKGHTFWRIAAAQARHDIGHGEAASSKRELYLNAGVMQFTRLHWSKPASFAAFLLIWMSALQRVAVGTVFGSISAGMARARDKYRLVAGSPGYWRYGYDPSKGLLTKLRSSKSGSGD